MSASDNGQPQAQPPIDGFTCPFLKQCWQRELFRWLAVILISLLTAYMAGCVSGDLKWSGWPPGISIETHWTGKLPATPATQPSP